MEGQILGRILWPCKQLRYMETGLIGEFSVYLYVIEMVRMNRNEMEKSGHELDKR